MASEVTYQHTKPTVQHAATPNTPSEPLSYACSVTRRALAGRVVINEGRDTIFWEALEPAKNDYGVVNGSSDEHATGNGSIADGERTVAIRQQQPLVLSSSTGCLLGVSHSRGSAGFETVTIQIIVSRLQGTERNWSRV